MQNKCNCGCSGQGFVPVSGNWDFNSDCGCQQSCNRRNRRSNGGCQQCGEYESAYTRERENDCQCERCDDARQAECCDRNTYVRDMDACESNYTRNRSNCGCDKEDDAYTRGRSNGGCKEGCTCEKCTRARGYDGDKDETAYTRNRSNCGCEKENGAAGARSRKNRTVGMINVEMQEIDKIFESESALRAGTLFPELHKPMNGYCPCDSNCGTCEQQAAFAAWELRLYLNTHPNDKEALALFRKLCKEAEDANYATTFLEDDCCTTGWNWVKNPWPWEYNCQCGD